MSQVRNDWTREEIAALFDLPFDELMWQAQTIHRAHHAAGQVQLSTLLSIKTGGCPEDCGYCSQSVSAESGVKATKLMDVRAVLQAAAQAKDNGSTRFCMGAAWRNPKDRDMGAIVAMVRTVAVARITMPASMVRLSAGRESMSDSAQALCFMAGANSIFTGDKLLTAGNAGDDKDAALFAKLGVTPMAADCRLAEAAE